METSKSTLTVAQEALKAGQESLPDYRRPKSPKKFTQPQLFACLVVKEFRRLDYRGIWVLLLEWSELRNVLGLQKVPHFTTLWAAQKRLLAKPKAEALLDGVLRRCRQAKILGKRTPLAAIDSTGLESRHVSAYYTQRCQRHQGHYKSRYPKLSAVGDTANHLILGCVVDRGPTLDITEAEATVREAVSHQPLGAVLGDPGYEAEGFHRFCREELHIRSIIPTTDRGRPRADGQPHAVRGHYRRLMKSHFPKVLYGQRWQAETTISMLKRNFGSALRARSYHSQNREIRLRGIWGRTLFSTQAIWFFFARLSGSHSRPAHLNLTTSVRPTEGLQLIRRSFIRGAPLESIMGGACRARKGKATRARGQAGQFPAAPGLMIFSAEIGAICRLPDGGGD